MKSTFDVDEDEEAMLRHVLHARRRLLSGFADIVAHHVDGRFDSVVINNHRIKRGTLDDEDLPLVVK